MRNCTTILTLIFCLSLSTVSVGSEVMEKFESDYGLLDMDLLNNVGEKATVKNFVYQKDCATFTFEEGMIHLLRYIEGRPTTAIFVGKGNAHIIVPSHAERQSLLSVTKDSVVNEDFEVCLIRMADDFDIKLKELFPVEQKELKWKDFTDMKQSQGEVYFRPTVYHQYDNYFQLLRSVYERNENGLFWIDFNRYNFYYDPNQPEEVKISYEFEAADQVATSAVCMPANFSEEAGDLELSNIDYETTAIDKHARIEMGGIDGTKIDSAVATMKIVVNADSLKYVSTFLHFNLKEDSIYVNGEPADYHRRKDFSFIGLILPEYAHKGDTITITYWYRGKEYSYSLPYVDDPTPVPHSFTFSVPKGFNYIMPGMTPVTRVDGKDQFEVIPEQPYDRFYFQGYASGYDTVSLISDMGVTVNVLRGKHFNKSMSCYIPDEMYQSTVLGAFNYMTERMGPPAGTFELYVYPEHYYSMPGLVEVPQILCYEDAGLGPAGGFNMFAGFSMSRQWFGELMKPASEREIWLKDAAAQYLSLMYVQQSVKGAAYFTNLITRRDSLYTCRSDNRDHPLSTGLRSLPVTRSNKGVWLFHMLRFVMFDLETQNESKFMKFMYELGQTCNSTTFTNRDVISLAEKHYGQPLDWFFRQWLNEFGYPEYKVEYKIEQRPEGYFIAAQVETEGVTSDFRMPVILRVKGADDEPSFMRENIAGPKCSFELGPFEAEPKELVFNEYYSVLSKDKVNKK